MTAAHFIREARRRHGLTQAQLAARARTSQAAISRIGGGLVSRTGETRQNLERLSHVLKSVDATLRGAPRDIQLDADTSRAPDADGVPRPRRRVARTNGRLTPHPRGARSRCVHLDYPSPRLAWSKSPSRLLLMSLNPSFVLSRR